MFNPDCSGLFGTDETRSGKFDPVNVLTSILTGKEFGELKFGKVDGGVAETSGGLGINQTASRVTITIDSRNIPGNWSDGNILQNAHTLLHELGHAFDSLKGSGGSTLETPDVIFGNDKRSRRNDWKVDQACFGGALGYTDPDKKN